jgi:hypothetical protein
LRNFAGLSTLGFDAAALMHLFVDDLQPAAMLRFSERHSFDPNSAFAAGAYFSVFRSADRPTATLQGPPRSLQIQDW